MEKKGLSQEMLKLIACVTMLIDHVGAALLPSIGIMRVIGRIAFPIYCFLMAEGVHYTRSPKKYALRLGIGMLLSELPFDLALFGTITLSYQNVMVTLLIGFLMAWCMQKTDVLWQKLLMMLPFCFAAELLRTDYGGMGVALIGMFVLTRELPHSRIWQTVGMVAVLWLIGGYQLQIGPVRFPLEMFGIFAMIPICLYSGRKVSKNPAVQWAFYLFYPVHLTIIAILERI